MKFTEAMIAWNHDSDQIKVGPWPERNDWSDAYEATTGACETRLHLMTPDQQRALLFIHFNTIVVGDGVDVQAAHRAFLKIDEYRNDISPHLPGADRTAFEALGDEIAFIASALTD